MITLTEKEILSNWEKLRGIITDTFEGDRLEKLNTMYDYFEERMVLAPASGKEHFHNAMVGGYVSHVIHVIESALQVKSLWEQNGGKIDFTDEELIFAAMHHDLGKVGDLEHDYYIPQDSDWHRKNRGEIYKHNPSLQYMKVPDRGLWLLQHYGVKVTDKEYLGIKLTDGNEMASISLHQLKNIFVGNIEMPMLKERVEILNEVGQKLVDSYEGDWINFINNGPKKLYSDGSGLIERLIEEFPRFDDSSQFKGCLLYTSPSPRDRTRSRMPSSA